MSLKIVCMKLREESVIMIRVMEMPHARQRSEDNVATMIGVWDVLYSLSVSGTVRQK